MKKYRDLIIIGAILVSISITIYVTHYLIFQDVHHIFIFLVGDIAFLPLEVLLVGIVVERILARREAEEKIQKLSMVIGAFYSEVGRDLVSMLLDASADKEAIISNLNVRKEWGKADFKKAHAFAASEITSSFNNIDLAKLKSFLVSKRDFLLLLIENPNLLEHERVTDLLLSAFHLMEELDSRPYIAELPKSDIAHIGADIRRVFQYLCVEWLDYLEHLKAAYPFLYSHYVRIHPFQLRPSAIVE
ncbi:MAG: hypothetical protein JXA01_08295 [Dehalococcoidia bacterium]|nr:hypothetical protein [Dehalococcoidia bacterium]